MLLIPLLFSPFPNFSTFLKAAGIKASLSNAITPLHSKLCQTALNLTPKGPDYTQIGTSPQPCITTLWFCEVLGQSQSWLRTMPTDLWKLYINSHILEFTTACPKIKFLLMCKNMIVFLYHTQQLAHCRKAYWSKFSLTFVNSRAFWYKFSLLLRCWLSTNASDWFTFFCCIQ